jgi:excinuclease UvrABC nuclease subunit
VELDVAVPAGDAVRTWSMEELGASRRRVPAAPGVYTFLDAADRPLYVGKSVDLRSRLSSYFAANPARRKTARMVRLALRVRAERTGSEFAALLREAALVQAWRPPFNQRMATPERYVYLRVDYAHVFPRVCVTGAPAEEGRYLGPYRQRRRVEAVVDGLNDAFRLRTCEPIPTGDPCWRLQVRRCAGPCVDQIGAGEYGREFLLVREALSGRARSALRRLRARRDEHAAAERFESARSAQNCIDAVEHLRRVLFASQVLSIDAIVVQPGVAPDSVEMWGVANGGIRCGGTSRGADLALLFDRVWTAVQTPVDTAPIGKLELDRRCIVQQWLRSRRGADSSVAVAGVTAAVAFAQVSELARRQIEKLL